jgi:hypothetical protein
MTLTEVYEQAQQLSVDERRELVKMLVDTLDDAPDASPAQTEHWGKRLNALLDEVGPIEMKYPEIEDSVEWVKRLRADQRRQRLGDWRETE